jgi:hypothetical protein
MRVRMTQMMCGARQTWLEGEEYDLPDELAAQSIRANVAMAVKEVEAEELPSDIANVRQFAPPKRKPQGAAKCE